MRPRAHEVVKLSWATLALVRRPMGSTSCPERLKSGSEGLQCRPPDPGDSCIGPRTLRVYHLSQVTLAWFRGPTVWTSSPGHIALRSDCPRFRPELRGNSRPCPRAHGVDHMSRGTLARVRALTWWTSCPARIGSWSEPVRATRYPGRLWRGSEGLHVAQDSWSDQISRTTPAWVRGPAGSTSYPRRVALVRLPVGLKSSPG